MMVIERGWRKSEQPHTSQQPPKAPHLKQPGRPTLSPSPSSEWVSPAATLQSYLYPGIMAKITHQVRHQRDDRPTQTTALRRTRPGPNYLPPPTPANIRPRCACRSFELVGACLVLTFSGHPPRGKRILIGPMVPVVDLRTRENTTRLAFRPDPSYHAHAARPASPGAIPTEGAHSAVSRHGAPAGRTAPTGTIIADLGLERGPLVSVVLGNEPAASSRLCQSGLSGLGDVFDMRHRTIPEERLCAPFCPPLPWTTPVSSSKESQSLRN